jgi:hypothetical protein
MLRARGARRSGLLVPKKILSETELRVCWQAHFLDARQGLHKTVWSEYGDGLQGFEKRYGAMLADRDASSFFATFLFPTLFHENPRYSRLGPGTSVGASGICHQPNRYRAERCRRRHSEPLPAVHHRGGSVTEECVLPRTTTRICADSATFTKRTTGKHARQSLARVRSGYRTFSVEAHAGWIEAAGATPTVPTTVGTGSIR